jgi:hypothetical protein
VEIRESALRLVAREVPMMKPSSVEIARGRLQRSLALSSVRAVRVRAVIIVASSGPNDNRQNRHRQGIGWHRIHVKRRGHEGAAVVEAEREVGEAIRSAARTTASDTPPPVRGAWWVGPGESLREGLSG